MTLIKETKPVVTDKHHFGNRDESFLRNNFLEILDYQDFDENVNIKSFSVSSS